MNVILLSIGIGKNMFLMEINKLFNVCGWRFVFISNLIMKYFAISHCGKFHLDEWWLSSVLQPIKIYFFGLSQLRQNVNVGRTLEHYTHRRNLRRTQLFTYNKPFNFLIRFCGNFHDFWNRNLLQQMRWGFNTQRKRKWWLQKC